MKKKTVILLSSLVILVIIGFWGHSLLVKRISSFVEEISHQNDVTYSDFTVSLFRGALTFDSVSYKRDGEFCKAERLSLRGFEYLSYFRKKKINFRILELDHPEFAFTTQEKTKPDSAAPNKSEKAKEIRIENIKINNGKLLYARKTGREVQVSKFDLELRGFMLDDETVKKKIPFAFDSFVLNGDSLLYEMNPLETVRINNFKLTEKEAKLSGFQMIPNYSRSEYIKVIPYEKDLILMHADLISIKDYLLDLEENGRLEIEKVFIDNMKTEIYRDKRVNDDPHDKDMYSKMLRDLKLNLSIDTLEVKRSELSYEEKQEKTEETGKVFFTEFNVLGTSITNRKPAGQPFPQTKLKIACRLMGTSPMETHWDFKVSDTSDRFRIRGHSEDIPMESVNNFFVPAFHMRAEGGPIKKIVFDFTGDNTTAGGSFNMVYDDVKIAILKEDGREKNAFMSFLSGLFVNRQSKKEEDHIQVEDVERNPKRSFWNYYWNLTFEGIKKTLI